MNAETLLARMGAARALLLDLDNTVYAYDEAHAAAMRATYERYRTDEAHLSYEGFEERYLAARASVKAHNHGTVGSRSRHLYFQRMLETDRGASHVARALDLATVYWDAFLEAMRMRPWVLPVLDSARERDMRIVIVTNLESSIQYRKLLRLGIANHIDYIVTSEEAGIEKPSRRIFEIALAKCAREAQEVVMIGDNPDEDGAGAEAMGITYISCV